MIQRGQGGDTRRAPIRNKRGANPGRGLDAPHHNPHFDIDEDVLPLGVATLMRAVAYYLVKKA